MFNLIQTDSLSRKPGSQLQANCLDCRYDIHVQRVIHPGINTYKMLNGRGNF